MSFIIDSAFLHIVNLSFWVAFASITIAFVIGFPIGLVIGMNRFRGRKLVLLIISSFLAFPSVVIGLLVFMLLANFGPLGHLRLLFTPTGMIIAQGLLVLPFVIFTSQQQIDQIYKRYRPLLLSLGRDKISSAMTIIYEGRVQVLTMYANGFSRALSAIGAVVIVGGNIAGQTRLLTTDISLQISQGHFGTALLMGGVLLSISLAINTLVFILQDALTSS
ncbi:MAG: ABC transporter permease [Alphaproteobacteria bacterium]|nr:ABC transporter permease [Alphaproteobacteria bacterium]